MKNSFRHWGQVVKINQEKHIFLAVDLHEERFIGSMNYDATKDVRVGDIIEFIVNECEKPTRKMPDGRIVERNRSMNSPRIIGYSVTDDDNDLPLPSQATEVVAAQSS